LSRPTIHGAEARFLFRALDAALKRRSSTVLRWIVAVATDLDHFVPWRLRDRGRAALLGPRYE